VEANWNDWIGRSETRTDRVTATPIAALAATLDRDDVPPADGDPLPPLWHWLYFLPLYRQSDVGPDGHARRGGFLPPIPLPRRMWAGSRFTFAAPLRVGEAITRESRIVDIRAKEGRSGALVFVVVRLAVGSSAGHVWRAVRENEQRVEVIGLSPYPFKLIAFVLAAFLAVLGGVVWLLLIGGATPEVTTANFTLALLVMVVLGGAGTRYGAMIGGFLYTLLDQRLGALSGSSRVQDLPDVLRVPLSEPLFLLGTLFILLVFFVPGGIASLPTRLRGMRPRREPLPEEAAA